MPTRRFALSLPIAAALLLPLPASDARAQPQQAAPASPEETRRLVEQLGDAAYARREEAAKKLRAIGKPALPAIQEAVTHHDPEVAARAQALLKRIQVRPLPAPDPHAFNNRARARLSITNNNTKVIEATERGREIKISEGPDGVTMTVTGLVDGKPGTEEYAADSAEHLRADNPEAFALYERHASRMGDLMLGGGRVRLNGGFVLPPVAVVPDELEQLRARLDKQMRDAKLQEAQRDAVNQAIDQLEQARGNLVGAGMDKYSEQCDELRKTLEQHKLDPGDLLPPPAKTRLGVSIAAEEGQLFIRAVGDDSRAQRLGLKPGDHIRKVDGQAVDTVGQLRTLISAKEKGLVVEITRDGQDLKLEEKEVAGK